MMDIKTVLGKRPVTRLNERGGSYFHVRTA